MHFKKDEMNTRVSVIVGAGGIGQAIARRQGAGKLVLLADFSESVLDAAARSLRAGGHEVATRHVDVSVRKLVRALAHAAAELGDVVEVVHTAGLSPYMASPDKILAVDLLGVALVLEEFGRVIAPGGAGIVISSMAGYMPPPLPASRRMPWLALPPMSCCSCPSSALTLFLIPGLLMGYPNAPITCACRRKAFAGVNAARV